MKVELLDVFGNDLMIANTARVSYGKHNDTLQDKDYNLIKYLLKHKHTSPFRHAIIRFRIECPIYVERQLFKHQIGVTTNSISGRYVDFGTSYTTINEWRKQSKSSKQGSEGVVDKQNYCKSIEQKVIAMCSEAYTDLLELGVSKEQARTILPINLNTTFIWTGSLQALIHLFSLRLKPDAQVETQNVVKLMQDQIIENGSFDLTFKAIDANL